METLLHTGDELGPAKILHISEPSVGLRAVLVIDNVAAGPSIGGVRMAPDVTTEECIRLARAMTLKNAAASLPHGGGKSVVRADPGMPKPQKELLIRAFAQSVRDMHEYIVGPDMGTNEECMAWVKDEINRAVGLPRELGGIPLDEVGATGWGLRHAAEIAMEHLGGSLEGARVVVQGFGAVGMHAARFLEAQGCVLVGAADSKGAIHDASGFDTAALIALKRSGGSVIDLPDTGALPSQAAVQIECDIWIPAARPDVLTEQNVGDIQARIVLQGANIPVTPGAERILYERGIVSIPDFIANAGGVICAAMEYQGATQAAAFQAIEEKVRANTREVLDRAAGQGTPPREAAIDMASARVRRAMSTRRFSLIGQAI